MPLFKLSLCGYILGIFCLEFVYFSFQRLVTLLPRETIHSLALLSTALAVKTFLQKNFYLLSVQFLVKFDKLLTKP